MGNSSFRRPDGRPAYHEAFGRRFWEGLNAHPDIAASFGALMGPAGHGVPDPQFLVDPADWESLRTVVDVGGGTGALFGELGREAGLEVRAVRQPSGRFVVDCCPT